MALSVVSDQEWLGLGPRGIKGSRASWWFHGHFSVPGPQQLEVCLGGHVTCWLPHSNSQHCSGC